LGAFALAFSAEHAVAGSYYGVGAAEDGVEYRRVGDTGVFAGSAGSAAALCLDAQKAQASDELIEAAEWAEFATPEPAGEEYLQDDYGEQRPYSHIGSEYQAPVYGTDGRYDLENRQTAESREQ